MGKFSCHGCGTSYRSSKARIRCLQSHGMVNKSGKKLLDPVLRKDIADVEVSEEKEELMEKDAL